MRCTVKNLVFAGVAVLSIASLAACARHDAGTTTTTTTTTHEAAAESPEAPGMLAGGTGGMRSSCEVLSESEMQAIVGSHAIAKETHVDGVPNSTCTYSGNDTDSVFTVEIVPADKIDSTIQQMQELGTASAGKEMVGHKGPMIVSVFNSNGKTKAIYDLAMSKL